jgi:uncharacterized protein
LADALLKAQTPDLPPMACMRYVLAMDIQKVLASTDARPWPLPAGPWVMTQVWQRLLFAHWPLPAEALRPLVPPGLTLDTFDGQAWLGIIPFQMDEVRFRWMPYIPSTSRFAELNVRTYVTAQEKPGIFFLSLDANSLLAILGARATYALPYHRSRFAITTRDETTDYRCERQENVPPGRTRAVFAARYQPTGPVQLTRRGTLEDWLTARYCLYTRRGSHLLRGEIHHAPWPLQSATAEITHNTMTEPARLRLPATPPLLHYSERLEVLVWPLRRAR